MTRMNEMSDEARKEIIERVNGISLKVALASTDAADMDSVTSSKDYADRMTALINGCAMAISGSVAAILLSLDDVDERRKAFDEGMMIALRQLIHSMGRHVAIDQIKLGLLPPAEVKALNEAGAGAVSAYAIKQMAAMMKAALASKINKADA